MLLTGIEQFVGRPTRSSIAVLIEMSAHIDNITDNFIGFLVPVINSELAP